MRKYMAEEARFAGLDSHAETIAVAFSNATIE